MSELEIDGGAVQPFDPSDSEDRPNVEPADAILLWNDGEDNGVFTVFVQVNDSPIPDFPEESYTNWIVRTGEGDAVGTRWVIAQDAGIRLVKRVDAPNGKLKFDSDVYDNIGYIPAENFVDQMEVEE